MINQTTYEEFAKMEKEYKGDGTFAWGNYSWQMDWDIRNGEVDTFVKDFSTETFRLSLSRVMKHELRDVAIVNVMRKMRIGTVLDIGADTGAFLARCKCAGIDGLGIEPNRKVVEYVNKKDFVRLFCLDLQTLMRWFRNNGRFDMCVMLNTFHGTWGRFQEKDAFARYLSENFNYVILSDMYKNDKPEPAITKYFDLAYDFNMYGMLSLRDYKNLKGPIKRYFKNFRENQIYEKARILSMHKLYIPKRRV